MTDLLELLAIAYLVMAFIKMMLCVPHIPTAIGVLSRLSGYPKGAIVLRYAVLVPMLVALVSLVGWVAALYREGLRFFLVYGNFSVMRNCVAAYRESGNEL